MIPKQNDGKFHIDSVLAFYRQWIVYWTNVQFLNQQLLGRHSYPSVCTAEVKQGYWYGPPVQSRVKSHYRRIGYYSLQRSG